MIAMYYRNNVVMRENASVVSNALIVLKARIALKALPPTTFWGQWLVLPLRISVGGKPPGVEQASDFECGGWSCFRSRQKDALHRRVDM